MSKFSKEYGVALYDLCKEENITEEVLEELLSIDAVIKENKEYKNLLDTPAIPLKDRLSIIDEAFSSCSLYVINFIKLLAENKKFYKFSSVVSKFNELYYEEKNIERVEAITCVPLSDEQTIKLKEKIEKIISKNVNITNKVDESIIGGVILKLNNKMYDGSIRKSLDEIACKIKSNTL